MNENENEEKNINNEIFNTCFGYQTPSFLANDLFKVNKNKNEKIKLRDSVIRKEIPVNENPNKVIEVVEKNARLQ